MMLWLFPLLQPTKELAEGGGGGMIIAGTGLGEGLERCGEGEGELRQEFEDEVVWGGGGLFFDGEILKVSLHLARCHLGGMSVDEIEAAGEVHQLLEVLAGRRLTVVEKGGGGTKEEERVSAINCLQSVASLGADGDVIYGMIEDEMPLIFRIIDSLEEGETRVAWERIRRKDDLVMFDHREFQLDTDVQILDNLEQLMKARYFLFRRGQFAALALLVPCLSRDSHGVGN